MAKLCTNVIFERDCFCFVNGFNHFPSRNPLKQFGHDFESIESSKKSNSSSASGLCFFPALPTKSKEIGFLRK